MGGTWGGNTGGKWRVVSFTVPLAFCPSFGSTPQPPRTRLPVAWFPAISGLPLTPKRAI